MPQLFAAPSKLLCLRLHQCHDVHPFVVYTVGDITCRFADIGSPSGMGSREIGSQAALDSWLAAAARMFPTATQPVKAPHAMDPELYAEPGNAICTL